MFCYKEDVFCFKMAKLRSGVLQESADLPELRCWENRIVPCTLLSTFCLLWRQRGSAWEKGRWAAPG